MVPTGMSLDTFVVSPELQSVPEESEKIRYVPDRNVVRDCKLLESLVSYFENAKALLSVAIRESDMHRARLPSG